VRVSDVYAIGTVTKRGTVVNELKLTHLPVAEDEVQTLALFNGMPQAFKDQFNVEISICIKLRPKPEADKVIDVSSDDDFADGNL
jgi:hypothetical protein